jgi:hypothetical protein
MKTKLSVVLIAWVMLVCMFSCTKDKTAVPAAVVCTGIVDTNNTYTKNIFPNIINLYCNYSPCHDAASQQDGINLSTYSTTVAAFESNNVVCAITPNSGCILMPNGGPALDSISIQQIKCWQANGYKQ